MRGLLKSDPDGFCEAAARVLVSMEDAAGAEYLLRLVVENGLLVRVLADSRLNFGQVVKVSRAAFAADPNADIALAKAVADAAKENVPGSAKGLVRILRALDEIADITRTAPKLLGLLQHPDTHLRSKAVGIVGRCGKSVQWVTRQLKGADARTRANAVEALWGCQTEEVKTLLRAAAGDANNRAAGNALVGLYRAGDCWAVPALLQMSGRESAGSRVTAAWAMGALGDMRFKGALERLKEDPDPNARRHAALSLKAIEEKARSLPRAPWRMAAIWQPEPGTGHTRSIHLAIRATDGKDPEGLLPTQFAVSEGGAVVTDYRVEERRLPSTMAFVFVCPGAAGTSAGGGPSFADGVRHGLMWKRPRDVWATVRYRPARKGSLQATLIGQIIEIALPEQTPQEIAPPDFTSAAEPTPGTMRNGKEKPPQGSLWDALLGAVDSRKQLAPMDASPRIVVYCPWEAEAPLEAHVSKLSMLDAPVPIDFVTVGENPRLAETCRPATVTFHRCASEAEAAETVERLCITNLSQYIITYESKGRDAQTVVRIVTPDGWAEVSARGA
jgi:hypothetical protein